MLIHVNGTPTNTSGCSHMPNRIHAAQVCDATKADSSNADGKIICINILKILCLYIIGVLLRFFKT